MEAITLAGIVFFVGTVSAAILTPGPAILACIQVAGSRGREAAVPYGLGLAFGASLWCLASIFGLSLVFRAMPTVYVILKIAGGLYLLWIAFQMFRHAGAPARPEGDALRAAPGFWSGVALNLSNPKPALFYGAIVLAAFPGLHGLAGALSVYGIALGCELVFYMLVATLFSTREVRRRYLAGAAWIDRIAAGLIGALGLTLIVRH